MVPLMESTSPEKWSLRGNFFLISDFFLSQILFFKTLTEHRWGSAGSGGVALPFIGIPVDRHASLAVETLLNRSWPSVPQRPRHRGFCFGPSLNVEVPGSDQPDRGAWRPRSKFVEGGTFSPHGWSPPSDGQVGRPPRPLYTPGLLI